MFNCCSTKPKLVFYANSPLYNKGCIIKINPVKRLWIRGYGPAKLNLLSLCKICPLVKICLLYILHRLWPRGNDSAKFNLNRTREIKFVRKRLLKNHYPWTSGTGSAEVNLLYLVKICLLYIPHRLWLRGSDPMKFGMDRARKVKFVKKRLLNIHYPWTSGTGLAKLNLLYPARSLRNLI